jgi:predicted transcriptional regulator
MDMEKISPHLTAKIVRGYVRHHRLRPDQLPDLIASVHRTLGQLRQPPEPQEIRNPAVPVRQSVRHDYVVCLDCGYRGKTLRRHIGIRHGLKGDEYRRRWGLRSDHPLTAPAYSEQRSTLAKELGLGWKSMPVAPAPATPEYVAVNVEEQVGTNPTPKRTRRPRSKSDVNEAAAEPTKSRQRRPRSRVVATQSEPPSTPTADAYPASCSCPRRKSKGRGVSTSYPYFSRSRSRNFQ